MTFHNTGLINFVQAFWVLALFLLIRLVLRRIQPTLNAFDWQYNTQMSQIKPRGNVITLLKIYSKVIRSTPRELAVNIRDELTGNAAMLYGKPNAFFVKYRSNEKIMRQYFQDDELRLFFKDPRYWARINGGVKVSFFGLIKDENTPQGPEYYDNLERIIRKFEMTILEGKKQLASANTL